MSRYHAVHADIQYGIVEILKFTKSKTTFSPPENYLLEFEIQASNSSIDCRLYLGAKDEMLPMSKIRISSSRFEVSCQERVKPFSGVMRQFIGFIQSDVLFFVGF